MKNDKKEIFKVPANNMKGREDQGIPAAKEPPYRDLPSDPVLPPRG